MYSIPQFGIATRCANALFSPGPEFMKYFTKKLWESTLADGGSAHAGRWKKALRTYREQLEALRPRFPEQVFAFFDRADIHEGSLHRLDIGDDHPMRVELEIVDAYDRLAWTLRYAAIRKVLLDFPSKQPLFHGDGDGFGDLGYHELTDCGGGFFRHEILFASGATLLVEFKDLEARRRERAA
jgi:hypothetical protein